MENLSTVSNKVAAVFQCGGRHPVTWDGKW